MITTRTGRRVITYLSLCYVREDQDGVVRDLSVSLAESGICVSWQYVAPKSRAGGEDFPALKAAVEESLNHCCHVAVLISRAFLARPWGAGNLDGWIPKLARSERIVFIWHGVSYQDVAQHSWALAQVRHASADEGASKAASQVSKLIRTEELLESQLLSLAGVNSRLATMVACQTCDGHPRMYFGFVSVAPRGASGLFVCPCCLQAYAVRDGVVQLRQESAIWPRFPEHITCS